MKNKNWILSPWAYCAEKQRELRSGEITFSKVQIKYFCNKYTHIDFELLTVIQLYLMKSKMVDLGNKFISGMGTIDNFWDGKKLDIEI